MFDIIWYKVLYQPLFNALIWIYVNVAGENLGWAVVCLTVVLRVILLPFTIISLYTAKRREKAEEEAAKVLKSYKNDPIAQREVARKIMRKYNISPWAAVVTLAIQFVVLVLLYQVFIQGITGDRVIKTLYQGIDYPGKINVIFYGFDIGVRHDYLWSGVATLYLILSILFHSRKQKHWSTSDMNFIIFFPAATFFVLWYLPMVKSLFILTTMIFSDIIKLIGSLLTPSKPPEKISAPVKAKA
jgi:membrane protein insertase Oxa1/YidC/SpoIIIJ